MHKLCTIKCFSLYFLWLKCIFCTQKGASNPHDTLSVDYQRIPSINIGKEKTHFTYTLSQTTQKRSEIYSSLSPLFLVWFQDSHSHNEANNPWFTSFYRVTSSLVWGCSRLDACHEFLPSWAVLLESHFTSLLFHKI